MPSELQHVPGQNCNTCSTLTSGRDDEEMEKCLMHTPQPLVPSCTIISNYAERNHYLTNLRSIWKLPNSIRYFAGPSPVSLERKDMSILCEESCMLSLKTDGVRYLLLLTKSPHGECIALMINRKLVVYEIEVWANENFFEEGTILDGELVWEYIGYTPELRFIVFDVVVVAGVSYKERSYADRLQCITNIVYANLHEEDAFIERVVTEEKKLVSMHNDFNMRFVPKRCVLLKQVGALWDARHTTYHKNDGLIFTLNNRGININTSTSIFKWKSDHTIDLQVRRRSGANGPIYTILCQDGPSCNVCDTIHVSGHNYTCLLTTNEIIATAKDDEYIVECACSLDVLQHTVTIFPMKVRHDKESPNSRHTIERTLVNIIENITLEEIVELFS